MKVNNSLSVDQVDWSAFGVSTYAFKADPATYLMCGLEQVT